MKKVLFITDGETPYRTVFFNQLAKRVELTVVCECQTSSTRDKSWNSQSQIKHKVVYLGKERHEKRGKTTVAMICYVLKNFNNYDEVIFGCVNTKPQIFTYTILRLLRKSYSLNLDGETIFDDAGKKLLLKKLLMNGAKKYYVAGEKSAASLRKALNSPKVAFIPYYFSSLTENEIRNNNKKSNSIVRENFILVVGRFFDYKGLDVALDVAATMPNERFKFIGMGKRTDAFCALCQEKGLKNVDVIPFLAKEQLESEYLQCKLFLLPTRRECWGLVVNEAASYGTPIISTYGSGAAVEFLAEQYPELLASPGDPASLRAAIESFAQKDADSIEQYSIYLKNQAMKYTIERNVQCYVHGLESS